MADFTANILQYFENGTLKPIIDQEFNLEQVAMAHQRVESNENIGKVLIKISDEKEHLDL